MRRDLPRLRSSDAVRSLLGPRYALMRLNVFVLDAAVAMSAMEFQIDFEPAQSMCMTDCDGLPFGLAPCFSPGAQCEQHWIEGSALIREKVFKTLGAFPVEFAYQNATGFKRLQPPREDLRGSSSQRLNFVEMGYVLEQLAQDQDRPAIAD